MPSQTQTGSNTHRLLRRKQIQELFGISRSTIYARLDPKSKQYDPLFPKPIHLGLNTTSIAWIEAEAQEYIGQLISQSRKKEGESYLAKTV